ncbi:hypothetical protein WMY93_025278 [Mugilogobius chulae]|uniref:Peptidase S1 domain-containing protein n=1 Tax=Mugilogobius chulae TaxID=88201 RepID=A0AAW0N305_9GOBI
MPVTKVQPFLNEDDLRKTVWERMLDYRWEIIISVTVVVVVTLSLGIGLGVGLSCAGKFKCGASRKCIYASLQCDGKKQCENGEDELSCVRLSGRSSVVQVQRAGLWMTVVFRRLDHLAGRDGLYVASSSSPVNSIELELQTPLVTLETNGGIVKLHNMTLFRDKSQCASGKVATLKCLVWLRPKFTNRIVGGNISKPGQFPWQVSLHSQGMHRCGGSLITNQWILTAAHCVYGSAIPDLWDVYAGISELPGYGVNPLQVDRIIHHHRYRPHWPIYDIALMKLHTPLVFNGSVEPICLPNHGEVFQPKTMCWISGWGATEFGGSLSLVLRHAMVPLISDKDCNEPQVYAGHITPSMICAGYLEGGVDSCQGDSGGPLACEDSSLWKLIGATSWGDGCADANKPGVYARITECLSWIRQEMERDVTFNLTVVNAN